MSWDPERYHRFQSERFAPFDDLVKLIDPRPQLSVADLGCGTGELTERLATALPQSSVLGVDSSPQMLARAQQFERPGLTFLLQRIEDLEGRFNLIVSNAALQWIDDHATLIPKVFGMLESGGQIAVQVPSNHRHPAYLAIGEIAGEKPFSSALGGWTRRSPVLEIDAYATLLFEAGAGEVTVFEKVYAHVLPDADAVVEWTRGTALLPYFERLPPELGEHFLTRYQAHVRTLFPSGPVFYPFRRTLFSARKSG